MRTVAQLDNEGFFLYFDNDFNGLAYGAIYTLPPDEELPEHYKWRWTGERYEATADYRGKTAYTSFGEAYTVEAFGPLPDGHRLSNPYVEPSYEEYLASARTDIKTDLLQIDKESVRAIRALLVDPENSEELSRIKDAEKAALELRAELSMLE